MESEALLQGGYRAEALAARDGLDPDENPSNLDVLEFSAGVGCDLARFVAQFFTFLAHFLRTSLLTFCSQPRTRNDRHCLFKRRDSRRTVLLVQHIIVKFPLMFWGFDDQMMPMDTYTGCSGPLPKPLLSWILDTPASESTSHLPLI